jgi:hypothetical protein
MDPVSLNRRKKKLVFIGTTLNTYVSISTFGYWTGDYLQKANIRILYTGGPSVLCIIWRDGWAREKLPMDITKLDGEGANTKAILNTQRKPQIC